MAVAIGGAQLRPAIICGVVALGLLAADPRGQVPTPSGQTPGASPPAPVTVVGRVVEGDGTTPVPSATVSLNASGGQPNQGDRRGVRNVGSYRQRPRTH